jgi:hypothetical protein
MVWKVRLTYQRRLMGNNRRHNQLHDGHPLLSIPWEAQDINKISRKDLIARPGRQVSQTQCHPSLYHHFNRIHPWPLDAKYFNELSHDKSGSYSVPLRVPTKGFSEYE